MSKQDEAAAFELGAETAAAEGAWVFPAWRVRRTLNPFPRGSTTAEAWDEGFLAQMERDHGAEVGKLDALRGLPSRAHRYQGPERDGYIAGWKSARGES